MFRPTDRRSFLSTTAAASAAISIGDLGFLSQLAPVSAAEAMPDPKVVQLRPEIEPLVRLLEESPRDQVLQRVAARIQAGASYRDILSALLLAGVRNIQPRPSVGFKFHAVLVVNSAHLASISSPDEHRWLPIFWAIDEFKDAQARDVNENNWTMSPVDESAVPSAADARGEFIQAMDKWDEAKADAAVAALARHSSAGEVFELFFRFGARDFRAIGHKAIFVANACRTLAVIGWHHAEPVLRSLAYALLQHEGKNPSEHDLAPDQPGRRNEALARELKETWNSGKPDAKAVEELLNTLRTGSEADACKQTVEMLNRGVAVQSVWDALFLGAGEYLMRQPGIVALHAVTSTNALRFAFDNAADDHHRRLVLLQNVAFLPLFREAMTNRGKLGTTDILTLEPTAPSAIGAEAVSEIFKAVSDDRSAASRKLLAHLDASGDPQSVIDAARVLIFLKGNNSHDYKFSSAVFEDYFHISPQWRNRFLASSVYQLRGSQSQDNPLVTRIRSALA